MTRLSALACLGLLLMVWSGVAAMAQVNVYTRSYDTERTGANLQETILTPRSYPAQVRLVAPGGLAH